MVTIQQSQQFIRQSISQQYPEPEAGAIAQQLLEHVLQKTRMQLSLNQQAEVKPEQHEKIKQAVVRLQQHEPLQYILGVAHFYDLELAVDERVLIPRPETEELVDLVVKQYKGQQNLHILDICTGSGCIPLALAANLHTSKVYGLEVSEEALVVAKANAAKYNLPVEWLLQDIFAPISNIAPGSFDIITSNPPYVLEEEKEQMRNNVLQFEPHLALFVPNQDPLKYYKRIMQVSLELLTEGGNLYFEINERYGSAIKHLLLQVGYKQAEVVQDLFGKDRIVRADK